MKRTVSILMTLGLAAGMVFADVKSQNAVGYYSITIPDAGGIQMIAVNVNIVGGDDPALVDVFGTDQLEQSLTWALCDKVILWDAVSQTYQTYAQYDGIFYLANDVTQWNLGIDANPVVSAGSAMWLDGLGTGEERQIMVVGQAVDAPASIPVKTGLQMLGFPFSSDIDLDDTGFAGSGASQSLTWALCDKIIVWDMATGTYQTYAPYDGVWYKANDVAEWNLGIVADFTVSMGRGFWYDAQSDFVYEEGMPYSLDD